MQMLLMVSWVMSSWILGVAAVVVGAPCSMRTVVLMMLLFWMLVLEVMLS
jgi:hypothetical protein